MDSPTGGVRGDSNRKRLSTAATTTHHAGGSITNWCERRVMGRKGNTYLLRDNVFLRLICQNLVISPNGGARSSHSAVRTPDHRASQSVYIIDLTLVLRPAAACKWALRPVPGAELNRGISTNR
jgi:hypothetical protein